MNIKLKIYPITCLLFGLAFIAVGIITLASGKLALNVAAYIGGATVCAHGLILGITAFAKKKTMRTGELSNIMLNAVLNIGAGIVLLLLPAFDMQPIFYVFTFYIFINGLIKLIDFVIDSRDNVGGRARSLVMTVFYLTFTGLMVFLPGMGESAFLVIAGNYCILYGASNLTDFVYLCLPQSEKNTIRRRLKMPVPVLMTVLRPFTALKRSKRAKILSTSSLDKTLLPIVPDGKNADMPPDIEVMIHVSESGNGILGHCDLCFEGEVISYGSYDLDSTALFGGVGDGILIIGRKIPHIRFYVTNTPREIYAYGFRLTEQQKQTIRDEIAAVKAAAYEWLPPFGQALAQNPDAAPEDFPDFGSKMWNCTGSGFYKFRDGKFKTYFVLSSNCVMLADMIIGKAGIDTALVGEVMTPGAYYDYLERQLYLPSSPVFCKMVYNKENTGGWRYTPRVKYSGKQQVLSEKEANRLARETAKQKGR